MQGIDSDGEACWCRADELCVDDPYIHTGLGAIEVQAIHGLHMLDSEYKDHFTEKQLNEFINFIKQLRITTYLEPIKTTTEHNPESSYLTWSYYKTNAKWTSTAVDSDYSLSNIELYIKLRSMSASLVLWNALIHAEEDVKEAKFRPNASYDFRKKESQLIYHLRTKEWIPDKNGNFHKPEDITREQLPDDFKYDNKNNLLTAIEFEKKAIEANEEYLQAVAFIEKMGFEGDDAREFIRALPDMLKSGKSIKSIIKLISTPQLPSKPVKDKSRRKKKITERYINAPQKEKETRERTATISRNAVDPTSMLRKLYTDEDAEQMSCQICKQEMPFKFTNKKNNKEEYYFESVEILTSKFLPREDEAQFLALCPVCAAKYKIFVKNNEKAMQALQDAILEAELDDDASSWETPITLDQPAAIRFVATHLFDLQTILQAIRDEKR